MGVRIQPTPALRRVVRGDYLRDMSYPSALAYCMPGLLDCIGAYDLGKLGTGLSRSRLYTVPKADEFLFIRRTNGILECRFRVTAIVVSPILL